MWADNRNLFLGLAFAVAAGIAFIIARDTYWQPVGTLQAGERSFRISLEQVKHYQGRFRGRSLQAWLGPDQASLAAKRLGRYHRALAGTLIGGFCTIFFLGLHLEALRSDRPEEAATR
jgi:hypothetical protein